MSYVITMDTGGTFSDLVLADKDRILGLYKAATTPRDVFIGIEEAIGHAAKDQGLSVEGLLANTETFVYSTTHATNAVLEEKTASTAFITSEGHRDILVYREGGKNVPLDIGVPYPEPYVPRSLTFPIRERVLADGTIQTPLDHKGLKAIIARLSERQVEAVGVSLLWSIANPEHELRIGEELTRLLPGVEYTLSHQLNPIVREYRRSSATVIDASLKPLMRRHLQDLDQRLRRLGFAGEPLMVTHLSGGVLRMDQMCEHPLQTIDSGPALAPVAGLAHSVVEPDTQGREVLVVDAGGTSFDLSPTRSGSVVFSREKWLGPQWTGHLTGLPAVETRSIGAGGGSIAAVDQGGLLTVGPWSAGADPGPACYDRGGTDATVTDAAVVLGYIDPAFFLGGRIRLSDARARRAVESSIAKPLGLDAEQAAVAVLTVFSESIRSFLTETMSDHGLDPRETVVIAGGGASGLNIVEVAREAGVPLVLIPHLAAGLSAEGGQFSDVVATFSRSLRTTTRDFDFSAVNEMCDQLTAQATDFVSRTDLNLPWRLAMFVEARYEHQLWELTLPLEDIKRFENHDDVESVRRQFDELHRSVHAVAHVGDPVEIVTWRIDARVDRHKPHLHERRSAGDGQSAVSRRSWTGTSMAEIPVVRCEQLRVGQRVEGPAILEESTTTIVLPAGTQAEVGQSHYLIEVETV